jgi:hypothetical protein
MSDLFDNYANRQKKKLTPEQLNIFKERTGSFFIHMENIYAKTWVNRHNKNNAKEVYRMWGLTLVALTENELYYGMEQLEYEYTDYPPNPFQFKKLCKNENDSPYKLQRFSDMKPLT